ncbi:hypothetical protein [Spiroplasma endosymbiont of Ammophila pubescens]|uniref:hypothetical protein n=1 Tax=Spiroplasma endosymbiont of Ammophila pubescens TaxID=3066315 RepID=UPI0032B0F8AD
MAQKGQKFNKYDQDLKNKIIQDFYLSHYSYKLISIKYSIPIGTLATWISHSKQTDYLKDENVSNKTVKTILQLSLNHLRNLKMEQKQLLAENKIN